MDSTTSIHPVGVIALPAIPQDVAIAPEWIRRRDELLTQATAIKEVSTQAEFDVAEAALKRVTKAGTELESLRKRLAEPFLEAQRSIKAVADRAVAPLEAEKVRLKKVVGDYVVRVEAENRRRHEEAAAAALEAQRREEEARAREDEARRKRDEEIASGQSTPFDDPPPEAGALPSVVPAPAPVVEVPIVRSMTNVRKVWKHQVVDGTKVPRQFCEPSDRILREAVRNGARDIPGVRIWEETEVSAR